jgi:hypothetical protein
MFLSSSVSENRTCPITLWPDKILLIRWRIWALGLLPRSSLLLWLLSSEISGPFDSAVNSDRGGFFAGWPFVLNLEKMDTLPLPIKIF